MTKARAFSTAEEDSMEDEQLSVTDDSTSAPDGDASEASPVAAAPAASTAAESIEAERTPAVAAAHDAQRAPMAAPAPRLGNTASGKNRDTENFPVGSFLIRPDLRPHVHAFYNFARSADDVADHPLLEPQEKLIRLSRYTAVLLSDKADDVPAAVAMRESLRATGIGAQHCVDLITAFKRDATQLRYADWNDLLDYCRYSASPVGRHVLALHGIGEEAWPANDALCSVLQIINHIQDCGDDYGTLDRVYIPQDMLLAHGADTADLAKPEAPESLRATFDAMLTRLDTMMADAKSLPRVVPDKRLRAETSVICLLAEKLIRLLRRRDPLSDHVKLGKIAVAGAVIKGIGRTWL